MSPRKRYDGDDRVGFRVQAKQCATCIYRRDSALDIKQLEAQIADGHGGFTKHRQCHHSDARYPVCCRGFWNRHRDEFPGGQIAQRLGMVLFVNVDTLKERR